MHLICIIFFKKTPKNIAPAAQRCQHYTTLHCAKMEMELIGIKVEVQVHVALFIMSSLWKNYEEKIKRKRDVNNKRKNASNSTQGKKIRLQSDELTVQRLSSSVEGKAQKYSRIGPREFIPYKNSDITMMV